MKNQTYLGERLGWRPKDEPREKRQWWAVHDNSVIRVTGFSCAPLNPDMWWCPEVGFSMSEKHHLFTTEAAALDKLITELERRATEFSEMVVANRLRRSAL